MKNAYVSAAILLIFLTTPAHGDLPYTTHPSGPICNEGTETPPIELTWMQLPAAGSVVKLGSPLVQISIANNTRAGLRVRVILAGALDEVRETLEVGEAVVQPGSSSILTVDLSRFKRDLGTFAQRVCDPTAVNSGTELDWLRFFWDLHTEGGGADGEHQSLFELRVDAAFQGTGWNDQNGYDLLQQNVCEGELAAQAFQDDFLAFAGDDDDLGGNGVKPTAGAPSCP